MSGFVTSAISSLARIAQANSTLLSSVSRPVVLTQYRHRTNKHYDPKWKKLRAQKVIKVKLPDYHKKEDQEMTPERIRSKMKEAGLQPSKPWIERQIFISCTGGVFEEYVPPEGDGKFSAVTSAGAKQKAEWVSKKGRSWMAVRKIRRFEDEFTVGEFEEQAQDIYIKLHEAIAKKDDEALRLLVTEKAFPEVKHNTEDKTIHWKFIESLSLPRVVHARCTDIISKENVFAQVTVRFHSQQTLAVYDRFGRLMQGSEIVKKDVLEYVVFEKHMANFHGIWRVHAKIIPPWMPEREHTTRTYLVPPAEPEEVEEEKKPSEKQIATTPVDGKETQPQATA